MTPLEPIIKASPERVFCSNVMRALRGWYGLRRGLCLGIFHMKTLLKIVGSRYEAILLTSKPMLELLGRIAAARPAAERVVRTRYQLWSPDTAELGTALYAQQGKRLDFVLFGDEWSSDYLVAMLKIVMPILSGDTIYIMALPLSDRVTALKAVHEIVGHGFIEWNLCGVTVLEPRKEQ